MAIAGCRNFNWAPTEALDKVSTTPPNTVDAPVFAPAGGSYNATQNVTLTTSTSGATICYRNDGTNADCDSATGTCFAGSTTYAGSISVPATITLNAMACKATMNNSVIATAVYSIDSTAPVVSAIAPTTGSFVTNTQVSYTLSETCGTGSITWTRTSGTADPGSPRVQTLVGAELTAGTHTAVTLTNNPALVNGTVYDITFNCTDAAGNAATPVTATNVTFDNVAPVISGVAPTTGSFRVNTQVSYTLSEDCQTGSITWTRTGGAADGASPHVQTLAGLELTQGTKTNLTLGNNPALVSGAIYTIDFACQDFAGQNATTITSTGVTFDNVAPIISGVSPMDSAFVSTTQVSYDLTEACASASITWTRTGGSVDPGSPHVQALTAGEMTAITHSNITITNNPTLIDGAIYSLDFNCTDATGNVATTVSRTNITYDPSAVVISAVSPASSTFRNNKQVSYTLSENCASGNVTWTRTGGNADPGSPRVQALTGAELTAGTKTNIILANDPALVDGAVYSVQFNCTDFASNASTPITITSVSYDFTAPVISAIGPASNSFVNNQQVSFTFSEACGAATITWTRVSGAASSNFNQGLTGTELTSGPHGPLIITNNPALVSGTTYNIAFDCWDMANNAAATVTATNVTFDNTPPSPVTIQNLRNNSTVHTGHVIGTANDNVGVTQVEFRLDGGAFTAATYTAPDWKFALPMGASTWRDRTVHTIQVQARDAAGNVTQTGTISVRKGNNRDINGDGYEDTVIGAWAWTTYTGRAYVFYGSPAGITLTTAASSTAIRTGAATNNFFGRTMALADFDSDGFADLAVGPYGNSTNRGLVNIFKGAIGGLGASSTTNITGETTPNNTSKFGSLVIAGDTNDDGYADLIVGANAYGTSSGRIYIFNGGAGGITQTTANTANRIITGEGIASQNFSSSLALGDFNGDSFVDLASGAADQAGAKGKAYIINGTGTGIPTMTVGAANTIGTAENVGDFFGGAMASGDINGDGVTDLVVGAYGYVTGANTGRAYIYYGVNGAGIPGNAVSDPGSPTTILTGTNPGAFFTTSIAVEDLNADGLADVAIGSYGCTANTSGCAYIFFGQGANIASGVASTAGLTLNGQTAGENFGRGIGAADLNGDGYADLVVGSNLWTTTVGRAFSFHSTVAGPSTTAAQTIAGEASSEFGIHVSR